jgi:hypothetical protein
MHIPSILNGSQTQTAVIRVSVGDQASTISKFH